MNKFDVKFDMDDARYMAYVLSKTDEYYVHKENAIYMERKEDLIEEYLKTNEERTRINPSDSMTFEEFLEKEKTSVQEEFDLDDNVIDDCIILTDDEVEEKREAYLNNELKDFEDRIEEALKAAGINSYYIEVKEGWKRDVGMETTDAVAVMNGESCHEDRICFEDCEGREFKLNVFYK